MSVRAIGLLSGGLDSALAARILIDQGVEVIGLHLDSPTACRSDVHEVARELGIRLEVRAKGEEYLRLLRHPRWGYGRHMNPCIDCRHYMFGIAASHLEAWDARFVFTGEVLGQRPMSQTRASMNVIDRAAGLEGWIVRPLSAKLLDETEPEKRGWVDRGRCYAISGRSRHLQLALADRWGLRHYQSPGGGCLLTDAHFAAKLRDLFDHLPEAATSVDDVALLRVGRHYRLRPDLKVVVGRDRAENERLAGAEGGDRWLVEPVGFSAPAALVCGARDPGNARIAAGLIAAHCKEVPPGAEVRWREGERDVRHPVERLGGELPDVLATAVR